MSAHGHAAAGASAAAQEHPYEGIPADRAGPDEPRTPGWLPLLGIGLVLSLLLGYVVTRPAGKTAAELAQGAAPELGAASAQPAASLPSPPLLPRPPRRIPGALPSGFPPGMLPGALPPRPGSNAPPRLLRPPAPVPS